MDGVNNLAAVDPNNAEEGADGQWARQDARREHSRRLARLLSGRE